MVFIAYAFQPMLSATIEIDVPVKHTSRNSILFHYYWHIKNRRLNCYLNRLSFCQSSTVTKTSIVHRNKWNQIFSRLIFFKIYIFLKTCRKERSAVILVSLRGFYIYASMKVQQKSWSLFCNLYNTIFKFLHQRTLLKNSKLVIKITIYNEHISNRQISYLLP